MIIDARAVSSPSTCYLPSAQAAPCLDLQWRHRDDDISSEACMGGHGGDRLHKRHTGILELLKHCDWKGISQG